MGVKMGGVIHLPEKVVTYIDYMVFNDADSNSGVIFELNVPLTRQQHYITSKITLSSSTPRSENIRNYFTAQSRREMKLSFDVRNLQLVKIHRSSPFQTFTIAHFNRNRVTRKLRYLSPNSNIEKRQPKSATKHLPRSARKKSRAFN